jgi:N6-L-threonylcarbamoyladenine synthase
MANIDCIAVTIGPGLSIALGVGIDRAKKMAIKYNKKLIAVNHLEAHLLSSFALTKNSQLTINNLQFPALGLVVSGGNTLFVKINNIGSYEILAQTTDDALGEALDKGARMLGLGYPGGAVLEKIARLHKTSAGQARDVVYKLPIPIVGQEERKMFTYSGLKTAMSRKIEEVRTKNEKLTKQNICDLATSFQDSAFTHLIRVIKFVICNSEFEISSLLVGGGVSANIELRKRLRKLGRENKINVLFPYSKKLTGDNAAIIGVTAYFKALRKEFADPNKIDRNPNLKI